LFLLLFDIHKIEKSEDEMREGSIAV